MIVPTVPLREAFAVQPRMDSPNALERWYAAYPDCVRCGRLGAGGWVSDLGKLCTRCMYDFDKTPYRLPDVIPPPIAEQSRSPSA